MLSKRQSRGFTLIEILVVIVIVGTVLSIVVLSTGIIPDDPKVRDFDLQGIPTVELDEGSAALRAAYDAFDRIISS